MTMKSEKIIFLVYPCMEIVCESSTSPLAIHNDPETNDLREYARITLHPSRNWFNGQVIPAGSLTWTKHASMLSAEQTASIIREAKKIEESNND